MIDKHPLLRGPNYQIEPSVEELRAEVERLTVENWQLKGALGYSVPGHIPCGDFKCGLCEARDAEIMQLREQVERLRAALTKIVALPPVDGRDNFEANRRGQELRLNEQGREIARRALENKP